MILRNSKGQHVNLDLTKPLDKMVSLKTSYKIMFSVADLFGSKNEDPNIFVLNRAAPRGQIGALPPIRPSGEYRILLPST